MTQPNATCDLVFCLNRGHFVGLLPAVRSILANAARPEYITCHFTVAAGESEELRTALEREFGNGDPHYEITEFSSTAFLDRYIEVGQPFTYASSESQVMNFARFYLPEVYPALGRIAYLDADIIVQGDIADFVALPSLESATLAAVPIGTLADWEGAYDRRSPHLGSIDFAEPAFNNGIYVTDLRLWKERRITARLEEWMRVHQGSIEDFVFGTQSIMNLAFHRDFEPLPPEWNVRPLGYRADIPAATLETAKILHWAGPKKPWLPDGLYPEHWRPFESAPRAERQDLSQDRAV